MSTNEKELHEKELRGMITADEYRRNATTGDPTPPPPYLLPTLPPSHAGRILWGRNAGAFEIVTTICGILTDEHPDLADNIRGGWEDATARGDDEGQGMVLDDALDLLGILAPIGTVFCTINGTAGFWSEDRDDV